MATRWLTTGVGALLAVLVLGAWLKRRPSARSCGSRVPASGKPSPVGTPNTSIPPGVCSRSGYRRQRSEVQLKSHVPMFQRSPTPATPWPSMFACLSQSNGIAAASSTSSSSILAHAPARALPESDSAALDRAVDAGHVSLAPVDVAGRVDVVPVEREVEYCLRVAEVRDPADVGADVDLLLGDVAVLGVHRCGFEQHQLRREAEPLEGALDDFGVPFRRRPALTDDGDGLAARVPAGRVPGEPDVPFGGRHVAFGVFVEVELRAAWPGQAPGFFEAGDCGIEEVAGDVRDERSATRGIQGRSVQRGPQRLAEIDVRERPCGVVQRDVVAASARRDLELRRLSFLGGENRGLRGGFALNDVAARENAAADRRVLATDPDEDLLQIGGSQICGGAPALGLRTSVADRPGM